jgi:5-(carboxyamino)imidazole ribonucleotide mutase
MAKVGIVMGSDSDLKVMSKAADMLEELGIEYELTIISAHREPDELIEWTRGAENRDVKVIIAGAGMAAALPGMCAALFALPVIGVPLSGKNLDGMDAVSSKLVHVYLSIMPSLKSISRLRKLSSLRYT